MPGGVPVGTFAIGKPGAINAALFAAAILALSDPKVKAALDQLTHCAALEVASKGVRVNAIDPGVTVTMLHRTGGMGDEQYEKFLEHSKTTHPLGRVGSAEEIAELILFLASPRAGWITGVSYAIDGGRHQTCLR